jgi:hypothetical protein
MKMLTCMLVKLYVNFVKRNDINAIFLPKDENIDKVC